MNILVCRTDAAGVYDVIDLDQPAKNPVRLGRIERMGKRWVGYDRHIGTFQGEDDATYPTLAAAKTGAAEYYAKRDFCIDGCGTLTYPGHERCTYCHVRQLAPAPAESGTVDDSITGTAADALEYGDSLTAWNDPPRVRVYCVHDRRDDVTDTRYNGWTNYATWRINLELADDIVQGLAEDTPRYRDAFDDVSDLASYIEEACKEALTLDGTSEESLAMSYAHAFMSDVNYYEIAEHMAADNPNLLDQEPDLNGSEQDA